MVQAVEPKPLRLSALKHYLPFRDAEMVQAVEPKPLRLSALKHYLPFRDAEMVQAVEPKPLRLSALKHYLPFRDAEMVQAVEPKPLRLSALKSSDSWCSSGHFKTFSLFINIFVVEHIGVIFCFQIIYLRSSVTFLRWISLLLGEIYTTLEMEIIMKHIYAYFLNIL